jgi:hypothetical protein
MAVVLVVAAVALLAISAVLGPGVESVWLRIFYIFAQWTGPLLLLVAAAHVLRRRLSSWVADRLVDLAGPALISAMPPRMVLNAVLARVFGDKVGHQEVTTALLGGGGRDPAARDTAVSKGTTVEIRFERIDESACLTEITWSHQFSGVRDNHHFVMFATTDAEIFTLVNNDRAYPLFEAWRFENEDQLDAFVPGLKDGLEVGISYRAADAKLHVVDLQPASGEEVALRDYDQFVKMPAWVDRQNLVIFHLNLDDFADPDHVVDSIERLELRASTVGSFDQHFTTWSAPHPCFVNKIVFDVRQLARDGETLVYQIVAATLKTSYLPLRGTWTHVVDEIEVNVNSWMLPGHAVTLLWRPIYGAESLYEPDGW